MNNAWVPGIILDNQRSSSNAFVISGKNMIQSPQYKLPASSTSIIIGQPQLTFQEQEAFLKLQLTKDQGSNYIKRYIIQDQLNTIQRLKQEDQDKQISTMIANNYASLSSPLIFHHNKQPYYNNQQIQKKYTSNNIFRNSQDNGVEISQSQGFAPNESIITTFPSNLFKPKVKYLSRNPETYQPQEGFKIYLDYIIGLPLSLQLIKIKYGIFKRGQIISLKNSEKSYYSQSESYKSNCVKIGEKMHIMDNPPNQNLFFYCEFWSLRMNPMNQLQDFKPRGWTIQEIFGINDIIETGKFKLPFYSITIKPDTIFNYGLPSINNSSCAITIRVCLPLDSALDNENLPFKECEYKLSEIHLKPISEVTINHFEQQRERQISKDSLFDEKVQEEKYGQSMQIEINCDKFKSLKVIQQQELEACLGKTFKKDQSDFTITKNSSIHLGTSQQQSMRLISQSFDKNSQIMQATLKSSIQSQQKLSKLQRQSKVRSKNGSVKSNDNQQQDHDIEFENFEVEDDNVDESNYNNSNNGNLSDKLVVDPKMRKREGKHIVNNDIYAQQLTQLQQHHASTRSIKNSRIQSIRNISENSLMQKNKNNSLQQDNSNTKSENIKEKIQNEDIKQQNVNKQLNANQVQTISQQKKEVLKIDEENEDEEQVKDDDDEIEDNNKK